MAISLDLSARVCPFLNPCTLHPNRSRAAVEELAGYFAEACHSGLHFPSICTNRR